jgi:fluoroquinolone transport system ATP-binding protein
MIEVQDLQFKYPGAEEPALRGSSFSVRQGEIFGLLGPSGAGKSTTLRVLIGLLHGYRGRVTIFGQDVRSQGRDYYQRIGVGFELPNVYSRLSARENLAFFAALYAGPTADPGALLEQVGLSGDADTRVAGFSKGMKMRLNFCRALINQPELVFLDEPTTGQDPGNARRLRQIIRSLKDQGRTVLLSTHNMAEATELCDRVAFIIDGTIPLIDSPRQLMIERGRRRVRVEYQGEGAAPVEFDLEGIGDNPDFIAALRQPGVQTIHTLEATLEDVFLEVTGRALQ